MVFELSAFPTNISRIQLHIYTIYGILGELWQSNAQLPENQALWQAGTQTELVLLNSTQPVSIEKKLTSTRRLS